VSDGFIFRRLSQRFLLRSIWTWLDYLVAFGYLAFAANFTDAAVWAWVPALSVLQWALTMAMAAIFSRHLPIGSPYAVQAMLGFGAIFIILTIDLRWLAPALGSWIEGSADWLTLVLPTGWLPTLFHRAVVRGDWMTLLLLGPVGLTLYAGFRYWKGVFRAFDSTPIPIPVAPPELGDDESVPAVHNQPANPPGPTEVQDGIASREFLAPTEWKSPGLQERFVLNRLTVREKLLTEVALGDEPNWSGRWRRAAQFMAAGCLVAWVLQWVGTHWYGWVDGFVLLVGAGLSISTGFRTRTDLIGSFPVSMRELARLKAKLGIMRSVCAMPLFALYGVALALRVGESPLLGGIIGVKVALILAALLPFRVAVGISGGTNDTREVRFTSLGFLALLLFFVLLMLAFIAITLIPDFHEGPNWASWAFLPGVFGASWLFYAYYRRQFNRCRFDLNH
jgi:hypothetical protein